MSNKIYVYNGPQKRVASGLDAGGDLLAAAGCTFVNIKAPSLGNWEGLQDLARFFSHDDRIAILEEFPKAIATAGKIAAFIFLGKFVIDMIMYEKCEKGNRNNLGIISADNPLLEMLLSDMDINKETDKCLIDNITNKNEKDLVEKLPAILELLCSCDKFTKIKTYYDKSGCIEKQETQKSINTNPNVDTLKTTPKYYPGKSGSIQLVINKEGNYEFKASPIVLTDEKGRVYREGKISSGKIKNQNQKSPNEKNPLVYANNEQGNSIYYDYNKDNILQICTPDELKTMNDFFNKVSQGLNKENTQDEQELETSKIDQLNTEDDLSLSSKKDIENKEDRKNNGMKTLKTAGMFAGGGLATVIGCELFGEDIVNAAANNAKQIASAVVDLVKDAGVLTTFVSTYIGANSLGKLMYKNATFQEENECMDIEEKNEIFENQSESKNAISSGKPFVHIEEVENEVLS